MPAILMSFLLLELNYFAKTCNCMNYHQHYTPSMFMHNLSLLKVRQQAEVLELRNWQQEWRLQKEEEKS